MIELILCFIILILFASGCCYQYSKSKYQWNNGACGYCNKGFWKSFAMCSGGQVGYSCTNCDKTIWR